MYCTVLYEYCTVDRKLRTLFATRKCTTEGFSFSVSFVKWAFVTIFQLLFIFEIFITIMKYISTNSCCLPLEWSLNPTCRLTVALYITIMHGYWPIAFFFGFDLPFFSKKKTRSDWSSKIRPLFFPYSFCQAPLKIPSLIDWRRN